jgi:16S rRNA processing protein RimM
MFFIHDLIGSIVYRNDEKIGKITDVLNMPANDVYVIENLSHEEILVPAVKDYVNSFDPVKKILILQPGGKIYEDDED